MKTDLDGKATSINLFRFSNVPMRTFHMSWMAFFLCFFGWFGIAPLMPIVREELGLTKQQIGSIIIASISMTVFMRLLLGWCCDRFGPRRTYSALLILGAIPVICIGFAQTYETFLLARLIIGAIGGSFVITQFHTSVMFAPNVVGTANATSAGWGNLGGGAAQMVMPLVFSGFIALGFSEAIGWRLAMVCPGVVMILCGVLYYKWTRDEPMETLQASQPKKVKKKSSLREDILPVVLDSRVWILFIIYGACFGIELTINNMAAMYYMDHFSLDLKTAGLIAGLFGLMNLFARTLGGVFADKIALRFGLKGRVYFLGATILCEGLAMCLFASMGQLGLAIATMLLFSLFVQMAEGATFSVVPFVDPKRLGLVAGIVGAGGNMGAVAAGFLLRAESLSSQQAVMIMGMTVATISFLTPLVRFSNFAEGKQLLAFKRLNLNATKLREQTT